ncbi:hypothetical protein TNCT_674271 [Trichonephila clavata]|uniref:Uncharacterized protein n=1 Tax=Trichonephila clavata TaxID=2740835 RepID=A0A8X6HJM2_TRICU|nr:hypothetical protein TNCT_674271 [Trichonephila clavata]
MSTFFKQAPSVNFSKLQTNPITCIEIRHGSSFTWSYFQQNACCSSGTQIVLKTSVYVPACFYLKGEKSRRWGAGGQLTSKGGVYPLLLTSFGNHLSKPLLALNFK